MARLVILFALLLGCGTPEPTCPEWSDLREWHIDGSPHVLSQDACGRVTTLQFRGPGKITLRRPTGGLVGVNGISTCADVRYELDTLPFVGRIGRFYSSYVLYAPALVRVTLPNPCDVTLNLEYRP